LSASLGVSVGQFAGDAVSEKVRSLTLPAGLLVESDHFGASAIYRYQMNSARNEGGHGGRLSAHASDSWFRASAFADVQEEAASLELVLRDEPVLAQLLDEMGLTATSADDLARLLKENATLAQLGYVQGASLEFNPWRAQAGGDVAWVAQDKTRQLVRLRVLVDRTQTVTARQDTVSASLSYSRRISANVDANTMFSLWARDGTESWSIAAGLRVRFDDVPHWPARTRDIDGIVVSGGSATPTPGVTVRLDNSRTATTDSGGHFVFSGVAGGAHDVEAELPDGAYFTGPSRVDIEAGGSARFTLALARLAGVVRDDAGGGIGGVTLVLRGAASAPTATTDSSGRFRFAVASGAYVLAIVPETIPVGYAGTAAQPQSCDLRANEPQSIDLVVPANRSIAGTVHSPGAASIMIVELGRAGVVDAEGRYVFRGLAPGTYTVEATIGATSTRHVVELGVAPTALGDVNFP
jgi:hypothetical protein